MDKEICAKIKYYAGKKVSIEDMSQYLDKSVYEIIGLALKMKVNL